MDPTDEQADKKKAAAQRSRKRTSLRIAAAAIAVGMVLVANQVWNASDNGGNGSSPGAGVPQTPTTTEEPDVTTTMADPGEAVEPTCPEEDGSSPRQLQFTGPPPECFDVSKNWVVRFHTNRGFFEITLDGEAAPDTVNNFVFLALWHFYDGASFHRIVPDFGIQGGDPIGPTPGYGGPGYTLQPEPPPAGPYAELSVLMASDAEAAHGSQFLILVGPRGEDLPLNYTRLGSVTAGRPVIEDIAATGSDEGTPTKITFIERVVVGVLELPE